MGRHQAEGTTRRGIATWPLVSVAVVLVLAVSTGVYLLFLRNTEKGVACEGSSTLQVMASAGASPAARALSSAFNATNPTTRSTCLTTAIATVASADAPLAVERRFADWTGSKPGVWVTDDPSAVLAVDASAPDVTAGRDAVPLATSPVVLAMRPADADKVTGLSWAGLAKGGPPVILTDPRTNRASAYALQSILADGSAPLTPAAVKADREQLRRLAGTISPLPTTGDALDELGTRSTPAAVPVTEADLAVYNREAAVPLQAVYPTGAVAGDEFNVIPLTGDWIEPEIREAATKFSTYARSDEGKRVLAAAHLRVPGTPVAAADGIRPDTTVTALPATGPDVPAAFATALGFRATPATPEPTDPSGTATSTTPTSTSTSRTSTNRPPVTSPTVTSTAPRKTPTSSKPPISSSPAVSSASSAPSSPTSASRSSPPAPAVTPTVLFLLDTSDTWRTEVEGRTRLSWLADGLRQVAASAGSTSIGLWQVSSVASDGGRIEVLAPAPVNTTAFAAAVDGLQPGGQRRNYRALITAVQSVGVTATAQHPVRIVLVTDGPDQSPSLPRAEVLAAISAVTGANPNVTVDTIGVGEASPDDALAAVAAAGNGTFAAANSTPELPGVLAQVFASRQR